MRQTFYPCTDVVFAVYDHTTHSMQYLIWCTTECQLQTFSSSNRAILFSLSAVRRRATISSFSVSPSFNSNEDFSSTKSKLIVNSFNKIIYTGFHDKQKQIYPNNYMNIFFSKKYKKKQNREKQSNWKYIVADVLKSILSHSWHDGILNNCSQLCFIQTHWSTRTLFKITGKISLSELPDDDLLAYFVLF